MLYNIKENQVYDDSIYKTHYEKHNSDVIEYFADRPAKLLVLNVKEEGSLQKLARFPRERS